MKHIARPTIPLRRSTFPAGSRLIKPIEFKRVFKNPVVSSDRYFKVLACRNKGSFCRLGMAVSRQVDRHAVGRNRIKRVIRESFRQSFEAEDSASAAQAQAGSKNEGAGKAIKAGIDFVVLPRREAATICNRQLFNSLQAHWSRIDQRFLKQETG